MDRRTWRDTATVQALLLETRHFERLNDSRTHKRTDVEPQVLQLVDLPHSWGIVPID